MLNTNGNNAHPPYSLANTKVIQIADYAKGEAMRTLPKPPAPSTPKSKCANIPAERTGGQIALRPSGTEPKIKLYLSTCTAYRKKESTWEAHFDMLNKELDKISKPAQPIICSTLNKSFIMHVLM